MENVFEEFPKKSICKEDWSAKIREVGYKLEKISIFETQCNWQS